MKTATELFDSVANLYHDSRPDYPKGLVSALLQFSQITKKSKILEVGCGTGQLTKDIAIIECRTHAIDPGPNLVRVASEELASFRNITFECISFEELKIPPEELDLIVSAQAWHWIQPQVRYQKALNLLKPGGTLAIICNTWPGHVSSFKEKLSEIYKTALSEKIQSTRSNSCGTSQPVSQMMVQTFSDEIENTTLFEKAHIQHFENKVSYTSQSYIQLLKTFSDHILLSDNVRKDLESKIGALIENLGGTVEVCYVASLLLTRKIVSS